MRWDEASAERYEGPKMVAHFWLAAPGVVATRVEGHVDVGAVRFYSSRVDRLLFAGEPVRSFHDWSKITGFDTDVRQAYRGWVERRMKLLSPPHILVKSKILGMAIAATDLVLRHGIVAHAEVGSLAVALESAIRDRG
jgi:hypothetical protein